MLRYNFTRIFKAKGIDRPFTFLKNSGFSENFATKISNNRIRRLDLNLLERLCVILNCTPNDLLEWIPEKEQNITEQHQLNNIKKTDKIINMTKTINSIPVNKLEEIEQLISERLKEN